MLRLNSSSILLRLGSIGPGFMISINATVFRDIPTFAASFS